MIVLDTNVIAQLMSAQPAPKVIAWCGAHSGDLATTSITVAEILRGIARLPDGRRRTALDQAFRDIAKRAFAQGILPFDEAAAEAYARLYAERERAGRPLDFADGQIAAIAHCTGAALATRNLRDFDGLGLELINPWEA